MSYGISKLNFCNTLWRTRFEWNQTKVAVFFSLFFFCTVSLDFRVINANAAAKESSQGWSVNCVAVTWPNACHLLSANNGAYRHACRTVEMCTQKGIVYQIRHLYGTHNRSARHGIMWQIAGMHVARLRPMTVRQKCLLDERRRIVRLCVGKHFYVCSDFLRFHFYCFIAFFEMNVFYSPIQHFSVARTERLNGSEWGVHLFGKRLRYFTTAMHFIIQIRRQITILFTVHVQLCIH